MGTRNLTCVVQGGEFKLAQYGQWDGDPGSAGAIVLDFLKSLGGEDYEDFNERVSALKWITKEEHKKLWVDCGADPDDTGMGVPIGVSNEFRARHPELHRDTGAEVLWAILDSSPGMKVQDESEFAKDSLFCEWAYVIDLDRNMFEVYKGFQKQPVSKGRFASSAPSDSWYYPVALVAEYELGDLPSEEDMITDSYPSEKDE